MPWDFEFSKEQEDLRLAVREFAEKYIAPRIVEFEENRRIPNEIIEGLAKLDVFGVVFPEKYGGLNLDPITAGVILEEIVRADMTFSLAVAYLVHTSWGYIASKYGSEKFGEEILTKAARGRLWIGIATTEPQAGSDVSGIRSEARREGNYYVLNGEKAYISGIREAIEQFPDGGGHLTLVYTNKALKHRGMTFFFVPMRSQGITYRLEKEFGRKGWSFGSFAMNDVKVPEHYRIGEEGRGFYIAMEGFDHARAYIALACAVGSKRALEIASEYIKQRTAFGQPIAKFQGVQFQLAEAWASAEAAYNMAYKALWMIKREIEGKADRFEVSKYAAAAKYFAVTTAKRVIDNAMRWMGAYAYTEENPLALALKAVKSYDWAEGALEIMQLIIAREVLGKEFIR